MISAGGVVGLVLSWASLRMIFSQAVETFRSGDETVQQNRDVTLEPFADVKEDAEVRVGAATFQTGNVFYEVLFTVINEEHVLRNYWYLGFSVMTLCLGC